MSNLPIFDVAGSAMQAQSVRLSTVASNLANADTPGYKARDIDFNAAMQAATQARQASSSPEPPARSDHLPLAGGIQDFHVARVAAQPSLDGNTVDPDAERAAYGRAALEYRASLNFLESKVRTLLTAITGQ